MKRTVRLGLEQITGIDGDGRMIGNKNIDLVEIMEIPIGKGIEGVDILRRVVVILPIFFFFFISIIIIILLLLLLIFIIIIILIHNFFFDKQ